jgi:predicted nucleotidyltransferase
MIIEQKVRLPENVIAAITKIFLEYFLPGDKIWLFGSRVDLGKRGGDIDLYVETNLESTLAVRAQISFLSELKLKIGDQKIDLVLHLLSSDYELPIYEIAKKEGVRLV